MTRNRHTHAVHWLPFLVAVVLLAGCGDSDDRSGSSTTDATGDTTSSVATRQDGGATVTVADSELGPILALGDGTTLYLFTPDTATTSECEGGCLRAWPAVPGPATAGQDVDAALLGTIERADGGVQATYDGHPLYTYAGDTAPGEVNGQGSGGTWFVIAPDGSPVGASGEPTNVEGRTGTDPTTTTTTEAGRDY